MMASNIAGLQPLDATDLTRIVGCRATLQDMGTTCKTWERLVEQHRIAKHASYPILQSGFQPSTRY